MVNRTLRTVVFNPANGNRFNVLDTAIVITDGQSNINSSQTIPEAELLQQEVDVYVIGVTNQINYEELEVECPDFRGRLLWSPCGIGQTIIFSSCSFFFFVHDRPME